MGIGFCAVRLVGESDFITIKAGETLKIGRKEQQGSLSLALPHAEVSSNHAEIRYESEKNRWIIVDLGSSNGTQINNETLKANKPYPLYFGDKVIIAEQFTLDVCVTNFARAVEKLTQPPQQDLTGIVVAEHTVLELTMRNSDDWNPIDLECVSNQPQLLYLIGNLVRRILNEMGSIQACRPDGCIATWETRVGYQLSNHPIQLADGVVRACYSALELLDFIDKFNKMRVIPFDLVIDITLSTVSAAENILTPGILLDGGERFVLESDRNSADESHLIVADTLTFELAQEIFSFEPRQILIDGVVSDSGIYKLLGTKKTT